jgi:hypothetical protein
VTRSLWLFRFGGLAGLAGALVGSPTGAAEGGAAGSYCPFPKQGETPQCLQPAVAKYAEFFNGLDDGEVSDAEATRLERDVASGAASRTPYLAISSLSYGYYRLAKRAANNPNQDPAVVARLQRWNDLLAQAYEVSADDPRYRAAVREAATDLRDRAPRVQLQCLDERDVKVACTSTEVVLRGINRTQERVGLRGALENLIERFFGGEAS